MTSKKKLRKLRQRLFGKLTMRNLFATLTLSLGAWAVSAGFAGCLMLTPVQPTWHCRTHSHAHSTAHPKRSSHAKTEFKHAHRCPSTGKGTGSCPGYIIDHVTALKRGGSDAPSNMQWQTTQDAKAKDKWE